MSSLMMNFPSLNDLRREVGRLFENAGVTPFLRAERVKPFPAMNVWEDGASLFVEAEVPGLTMNDLEIFVEGNDLTVKGRRQTPEGGQQAYHRRERGSGEFARYLTLPMEVDANRVEATLKDGVLTILLPKAEKARARKVTVKTT